jgi:hypothetical protein
MCSLLLAAGANSQTAANKDHAAANDAGMGVVTGVQIVHDADGAAIEISSTGRLVPKIESRDTPPQIIINLPNARSAMPHKRIDVLQGNILTIRSEEHAVGHRGEAPFLRIVVSFLVPYGYEWSAADNRLMVRLKPPEDPYVASQKSAAERPQAAAVTPMAEAAVVPVTSGIGDVLLAGRRFAAGSSITAGSETAVLQLARGGQIEVCPGTALSVTPSQSKKDLMIGLSTGAMETHYRLDASADTILTPDFRILLAGPGEFNYAISSDSKGNTCVRGLAGNSSSVIVSELIGERVYQVKPAEQAVFHDGRIDKVESDVPAECGCPAPSPVIRAEAGQPHIVPDSESPNLTLAQGASAGDSRTAEDEANGGGDSDNETSKTLSSGPETRPLPRSTANAPHVQVEAPLVFRGRANSAAPSEAAEEEAEALPVTESTRSAPLGVRVLPPAEARAPHQGVFHRIKRFFRSIFF